MKFGILHLSDIHIKSETDPIIRRAAEIASTTYSCLPEISALFVVVSGDIAFSGKATEYDAAYKFFSNISNQILQERKELDIHFVIAPGNHDCDFSEDQTIRNTLIDAIVKDPTKASSDQLVEECAKVQRNFFEFRKKLEGGKTTNQSKLWTEYRFEVAGKSIVFECLNVSWMSRIHEVQGELVFPLEKIQMHKSESVGLCVSVLHHPLNWYGQATYRPFRQLVRSLSDIVITGHEHVQQVGENWDDHTEQSAYIEGGVLQSTSQSEPTGFNFILIDMLHGQYCFEPFTDRDSHFQASGKSSQWTSFRQLPIKHRSEFEISPEFSKEIDNPGANFSHPGKTSIVLEDIFVFPDLRLTNGVDGDEKEVSSSLLSSPDKLNTGILIKGEEKSGKTSLLYSLFRKFHGLGYVPVYIRGKEISKTSDRELRSTVDAAIKLQYGARAIETFSKLQKTKKILLLDDIERQKTIEKHKGKSLKYLLEAFGGVLVTSSDLFELDELIIPELTELLGQFRQYQVLPFGHKLRLDLVRKWTSLGDSTCDSATVLAQVDRAEKLLGTVVGKNLVPSVPIYLLILLQSFEAGRQGDLQNSAFGYYYEYLILHSLGKISVKPEEIEEFFHYCSQLTWFALQSNAKELELAEIKEFNRQYSVEFTQIEVTERLRQLCDAKLLAKHGGSYYFCYPYVYYFFLGKYLSENLDDSEVQGLVREYCAHLYVKDYANTILFLTHHSKDPSIYNNIKLVLKGLFADKPAIDFDGDTAILNELVDAAPALVYHDVNPDDGRRNMTFPRKIVFQR